MMVRANKKVLWVSYTRRDPQCKYGLVAPAIK